MWFYKKRLIKNYLYYLIPVLFFITLLCTFSIPEDDKTVEHNQYNMSQMDSDLKIRRTFALKAKQCFIREFDPNVLRNTPPSSTSFWLTIPSIVEKCSESIANTLPVIETIPLTAEHKWYMMPRANYINDSCSVITFGIGGKINDEQHIKTSLPQCTFLGFDPNEEFKEVFEKNLGGRFIHTGVAGKSGYNTIYKLENNHYNVATKVHLKSAAKLIQSYHGKDKLVDILDIDIEGSEYSILERLYQDKVFQNVCQINIELHPVWYHDTGYSHVEVIEIFKKLIEDGTFIWIRSVMHTSYFYASYFINVKNEECVEKYLNGRLF